MRRRIVVLLLPVLVILAVGAVLFVGVLVSDRLTQQVYVDRMGDATRFAAIVGDAIDRGQLQRLQQEAAAYTELYDSPVWVLGIDGVLLHDPGAPLPAGPETRDRLQRAFHGERASQIETIWPWSPEPILAVEPVGRDSQVVAVIAIQAPTDRLRTATLTSWTWRSAALLLPIAGLLVGLWPVTRWILRPVRELETVASNVTSGDLDARADVDRGPPELRELATGFNTMIERVERSLRRQREFVADAAHQLRNPLATLRLTVESMRPWMGDQDAREAYEDALAESTRLSEMFDDMLAATELTGAEPMPESAARPLHVILSEGLARWQRVLMEAGMTLEVLDPPEWLVLREPAGGLAGLIDELVANAARLSQGREVRIGVEAPAGRGDRVRVFVADDGVGLSAAEREVALGRFWRANRHQNVPGTGLGLAIVADLVADAGGVLTLEPVTPRGLRVFLALPMVQSRPVIA